MKLNLGAGKTKIKNFLNVDIVKSETTDIIQDLNKKKWEIKDNTIKEIKAHNILEHLQNVENFMNNTYRILKKNGTIEIKVPFYNSSQAPRPDHEHFFRDDWYIYFLKNDRPTLYGHKTNFKLIKNEVEYLFPFNFLPKNIARKLSYILGSVAVSVTTTLKK